MYKYHPDHMWVKMEGGEAIIGISRHAQAHMGEIIFVDLPEIGSLFSSGEILGELESSKAICGLTAPVGGRVLLANEALKQSPWLINQSPLDEGWMTRLALTDPNEIENLMDQNAYDEYLASQSESGID